MRDNKMEYKGA